MDTATEILVIITSSVLVLCLLFIIVATIQIMLLIRKVKQLLQKAENVAETVEAMGSVFNRAAVPALIGKKLTDVLSNINDAKKRRR